jgi:hypothetical protein
MPRVRVLHASPDAPAVDIYVDRSPAIMNLSFGMVSDYAELPSGSHNVQVFPAGMGGKGNAVISADVELASGQDYTVTAVGMLANIQAMVLTDTTAMPGMNMAKVRVLHVSPDAPAVDVAVTGGPVLFMNIPFKSGTPWQEVQSGMVDLEIRPTGSLEPVLTIPNVTVSAGNAYTFVALGLLRGMPSFRIMPIVDRIVVAMPA